MNTSLSQVNKILLTKVRLKALDFDENHSISTSISFAYRSKP